jgi:ABC-2 type transport system permease protein
MSAFVQETWSQLRRWLLRLKREPFNLTFALLQPLLFFVFFGGAFENMVRADVAGPSYRAFILGGVLTLTVFGNSMAGGIPILFDKENGFLTRCLVAPISRSSIFVARFLAVNLISAIQTVIFLALALAFGVHVQTGIPGVLLLIGIGWLLGLGVTVVSLSLAFKLRGHGDFFAILGTVTLPAAFMSTAFVRLEQMPGWMRVIAQLNPLTYAADGMRAIIVNHALDGSMLVRQCVALLVFDALLLWMGVRTLRAQVG